MGATAVPAHLTTYFTVPMPTTSIDSHQRYTDATFKNVTLTDATLTDTQFLDCTFTRCDFSNSALRSCRFVDCTFNDSALKMTALDGTAFAGTRFSKCNLLGVDWTKADWSGWAAKLNALTFDDCDLRYAVFFGLKLPKLTLTKCRAIGATFAEADLTEADLRDTDFAEASFHEVVLTKANFVGARNYAINLADVKSAGAKFALPEATRLLYYMDIDLIDPYTGQEIEGDRLDDFTS